MGIALAVAALLAGTCAVSAYAVPETDAAWVLVLRHLIRQQQMKATILCGKLKFQITIPAYHWYSMKKLSLEEQAAAIQDATTPRESTAVASSGAAGSANIGAAASMAASVEAGQFAFTTYGYGHCVGMSRTALTTIMRPTAAMTTSQFCFIIFRYHTGAGECVQHDHCERCDRQLCGYHFTDRIQRDELHHAPGGNEAPRQSLLYSYIMFNGGSVNNVILKPNPPQNVIDAVSAVAGQALYYDGDAL